MTETMPANETGANAEVLAFYKELPFNFRESTHEQARGIRKHNHIDAYPILKPLLARNGRRVLEVGCGVGWMSNAIAHYYGCTVNAIDFNPVAIERARDISKALGTDVRFEVADLFTYEPETAADVAISLGVLHHTNDFLGAVRRMFDRFTAPGGHTLIGLYHAYGRKPFLEHFAAMKADGASEEALLDRYRQLNPSYTNETHLRSWFRDQVLHPHETQHTLAELLPVMAKCGMTLEATSINRFGPIDSIDAVVAQEKSYEGIAEERLREGKYFPGFFVVLARKTQASEL